MPAGERRAEARNFSANSELRDGPGKAVCGNAAARRMIGQPPGAKTIPARHRGQTALGDRYSVANVSVACH